MTLAGFSDLACGLLRYQAVQALLGENTTRTSPFGVVVGMKPLAGFVVYTVAAVKEVKRNE